MNKQELIGLAQRNINSKRQAALAECDRILEELRSHNDWRICEQKLRRAEIAVAVQKQPEEENIQKYTTQRDELLKKYGYTIADLSPKFSCKICGDTGRNGAKACVCLQNEIRKLILSECNIQNSNCTFQNSAETDKHNIAVYKKAREVCEQNSLQNMLLLGKNGTGKTFLLSACANLCAELNKSVAFVTAYNLNSLFLECHLGDLATNKTIMDSLTDVDVLLIDDLGTEITYNNVTAPYLFALLNERIASGKQTFLSSNLTFRQLENRYDGRIFSRLLDKRISLIAELVGADKRLQG